jgi:hypothetical protein
MEDAGPTRAFPAWIMVDARSGDSRGTDDDGAETAAAEVAIVLAICGVMIPVPPVLTKSRTPTMPRLPVRAAAAAAATTVAAFAARDGDAPPTLVLALGGDATAPGMVT